MQSNPFQGLPATGEGDGLTAADPSVASDSVGTLFPSVAREPIADPRNGDRDCRKTAASHPRSLPFCEPVVDRSS